jgi:hypothetical protein
VAFARPSNLSGVTICQYPVSLAFSTPIARPRSGAETASDPGRDGCADEAGDSTGRDQQPEHQPRQTHLAQNDDRERREPCRVGDEPDVGRHGQWSQRGVPVGPAPTLTDLAS